MIETPGEFQNRKVDAETDIKNVKTTIDLLVKQRLLSSQNSSTLDVFWNQGKATLIPKPGEFSSENRRPITPYISGLRHTC